MSDLPKLAQARAGPTRIRRVLNAAGLLLALILIILGFAAASQI